MLFFFCVKFFFFHSGNAFSFSLNRIHWAGTETSTSWYGQMEGALESADRVATEVVYYLNRVEGEDLAVYTDAEEVRERTSSIVNADEEDSVSTNTL